MHAERLLTLATYLETVVALKPGEFDMDHWAMRHTLAENACGTTCCAVGHACDIPEFKAAGLRLKWYASGTPAVPAFDGLEHGEAVMLFFGITSWDVDYLFTNEGYWGSEGECGDSISVEMVASRLRAFVASHTPAAV